MKRSIVMAMLALAGCDQTSPTYTLYRNSSVGAELRIHFASFDASDKGLPGAHTYNQENCQLAADVLNENVGKLNEGKHPARFWCEKGSFRA